MGLLDSVIEAAKQQYQTTKRGFGLLASNPQQFAQEATARYFPTKEEEAQFAQAQAAGGDYMQTPYYQKVMNLSQFQGSIKPTGLINAPQQAALDLAQKNAALPVKQGGLGLPENNTAADRAKAMGFNIETYHGTDAPKIESFDPKRTKIIEGVFSAYHPRTASLYAEAAASKGRAGLESAPNVMPLLLNSEAHVQMPSFNKEMIDSFRNTGYAGVKRPEAGVAVTFDPAQIRSRFAAFDPFRKDVATATAMGVAAPDLLAAGVPLGLLGTAQQTVNLPEKKKSKK
jgi:hypothetical protein